MSVDWQRVLTSFSIPFVTKGPNVSRGHINIKCPFCGHADPSEHMGIELGGTRWGCFRDSTHRGRSPERLLMALLRLPLSRVKELVETGEHPQDVDLDQLGKDVAALSVEENAPDPEVIEFPKDFRGFVPHNVQVGEGQDPFNTYLSRRGYNPPHIFAHRYGLRWAITGDFKHRLIIPFCQDEKLVGWTGRAIFEATVRYKSYPPGSSLRSVLGMFDLANQPGEILFITEGPMDALNVNYIGSHYGHRAVALLGLTLTPERASRIMQLAPLYRHVCVLLDQGAEAQAMRIQADLSVLGPSVVFLEQGDPGDLTLRGLRDVVKKVHASP